MMSAFSSKRLFSRLRSLLDQMPIFAKAGSLVLVVALVGLLSIWQFRQSAPDAHNATLSQSSHGASQPASPSGSETSAAPNTPSSTPGGSTPAASPASTPKPAPSSAKPAAPKSNIPLGTYTTPPVSTEFRVSVVTLQWVTSQCSASQRFFYVPSAMVSFTSIQHVAGTLRWYWEAKIDSGENNSGQPAVDGYVYTHQVPTGQGSLILQSTDPGPSEILVASSQSTYAYSFRLHIIAPNDAVTAWVSVPQGGC